MADQNEDIETTEEDDAPKPKVKILRSTYTTEQLHDAVQKARTEERDKHRDKISNMERELEKFKTKNGGVDVEAVIAQAVSAARDEWEKKHAKEMRRLGSQVTELASENKLAKLEKARQRIIAEYQNQVIPALIVGETEEELEESAKSAHEAFKSALSIGGVEFDEEEEVENTDDSDDEDDEEEEVEVENESSEEEDDDESSEKEDDDVVHGANGNSKPKFKKSAKRKIVVIKKSPPASTKKSQVRTVPPVLAPLETDVRGRRNDPLTSLKAVKGMSPSEYRNKRQTIITAAKQKFG